MPARPSKVCFVTIGATALFDRLLNAVLDQAFLEALHGERYTNVILQHGKGQGKAIFDDFVANRRKKVQQSLGVDVSGFDFNPKGLDTEMRRAKGHFGSNSAEGLVISHAGDFKCF